MANANNKWRPGQSGNPAGKKPGTISKDRSVIREKFADFVENHQDEMMDWIREVAKTDKKAAFEMMTRLLPYMIPKKSETDITTGGEQFSPVNIILPKP